MAEQRHTAEELTQWQALPLEVKVGMTMTRIRQWVNEFCEDGVYISFSGGKDSMVLSHLVDRVFPGNQIPRLFVNTGLEFPEIVAFVKTEPRAVIIRPQMNFKQVIEKYGYPFISKDVSQTADESRQGMIKSIERLNGTRMAGMIDMSRWKFLLEEDAPRLSSKCCKVMKKRPAHKYEKETGRVPMTAEMACESLVRRQNWLKNGCNMYDRERPKSTPMAFWTEQDVLAYVKKYNLPICSVYGDIVVKSDTIPEQQMTMFDCGMCGDVSGRLCTTGMQRTGCMFCGYGAHHDEPGKERFVLMKQTHPKIYEWIMKPWEEGGLDYKKVIDWLNEHGNLNIKY